MGINVGLSNWPTHDGEIMAALESFALAQGRRWDNTERREKPLDEVWWREATKRREIPAQSYGIHRGYGQTGESVAWAIEDFLKYRLHLQDWLDRGHRMGMQLAIVPFKFGDGARGDLPWTEIRGGKSALLIGHAIVFATYWDGAYESDKGRAYRARAEAAYAAIRAPDFDPRVDPDAAASQIQLALELVFNDLVCVGWDNNLLVDVSF